MPIHLPPLSRRRFLQATFAAGAAAVLPRAVAGAPTGVDPNRVALLADTHVWADPARVHHGIRSVETAAAACRQIRALDPLPAHLVIAGDCAADVGEPGDYATLGRLLKPLREAGVTVHLVLGNHDHRENFYAAFPESRPTGKAEVPGKHAGVVKTPRADFVLLDSLDRTNVTPGRLGEAQRRWLAGVLDRGEKPAFVVAHHNPDRREKPSGLTDTAALFDVLVPRRRAKAYAFGHSHAWWYRKREDVHCVNVPAVAWLFDKTSPRGWLDAHLETDGARLVLQTVDESDSRHGQVDRLAWRT
ncbi:MAG: metallophosphoesterase [Phycisphaerae bacterium]